MPSPFRILSPNLGSQSVALAEFLGSFQPDPGSAAHSDAGAPVGK